MAWFTPSLARCKGRIAKEWPALSSAAKMQGEDADTIGQEVIDSEVKRIVGRIPSTVPRGESGTIPDEMEIAFYALWVWDFITKLPSMKSLLDSTREKSYDTAIAELAAMSNGKINIAAPVTEAPEAEQAAGPGIEVAHESRCIQNISTSGLL